MLALSSLFGVLGFAVVAAGAAPSASQRIGTIATNRTWDVLPQKASMRARLAAAGKELDDWTIDLAGTPVDGKLLIKIAHTPKGESLVRASREALERPVDVDDFVYFLDDVLAAGRQGARGKPVVLTPERARRCGVFLSPDDVFFHRPRIYGKTPGKLSVDPPEKQIYAPAEDGSVLGPDWSARYANPPDGQARLAALRKARPKSHFAERIHSLISQLRGQGAVVSIDSTVRARARGYLMWGAFWLSRAKDEAQERARIRTLNRVNDQWGLAVPILWSDPRGWRATVASAQKMADAYDVVYATRRGARKSHHYQGRAVDMTAVNLPRTLTLRAPDSHRRTFDLSAPYQSRDLSLTPALIRWIDRHFHFHKLKSDYPHWDDAR